LARHNHEVRRIHLELSGISATRSLEVGCGFGRLSMTFAAHSIEHVAIDINESALATARQSYKGIEFMRGSTLQLPFPDEHFDRRVLAPGGALLICEETRDPGGSGGHTWHRTVVDYEHLLDPLRLSHHGHISEIDLIPGLVSPGEVLMFHG
jgi:SAM-dependent methyltransferase